MDRITQARLERKLARAVSAARSPLSSPLEAASADAVVRRLSRKLAAL